MRDSHTQFLSLSYDIIANDEGWGVSHDGSTQGHYLTKEPAFEAAVAAASNAIKEGYSITIKVVASQKGEASKDTGQDDC